MEDGELTRRQSMRDNLIFLKRTQYATVYRIGNTNLALKKL